MQFQALLPMKKSYFFFIPLILLIILLLCFSYLFFTNHGSNFVAKSVISHYIPSEKIDFAKTTGSLSQTLVFNDIVIPDLKIFPSGSILRIQRLEVAFPSFDLEDLTIKMHNARLQLPNSGLILFHGKLQKNVLDFNFFSKGINIKEILSLLPLADSSKQFYGFIKDIDIFIKGSPLSPSFEGECLTEKLTRNGFSLSDCHTFFNLRLEDIKNEPKLYGIISANKGSLSGPKAVAINLGGSKLSFSGNPTVPLFDIKGTAMVEGVSINLSLKGTIENPALHLTSSPPYTQNQLLAMLVTGKKWGSATDSLEKGYVSADLVGDFIDYFIFSGSASKIASGLGLSDFSVTLEKQKKALEVKKSVTDKIDARYSVEQSQPQEGKPTATQKVGGEYKITENIALGAEKELKKDAGSQQSINQQKTDDKVYLKIKKEF